MRETMAAEGVHVQELSTRPTAETLVRSPWLTPASHALPMTCPTHVLRGVRQACESRNS
jgi:hypothetical protein